MTMRLLKILIAVNLLIVICSCGKDPEGHQIEGKWSVINVSGGIAGIICDLGISDYEWTFEDGELTTQLNNPSQCFTFTERDPVDFSILEDSGKEFLEFDGQVQGEITFSNDSLFFNTNSSPIGSGADGFVYVLVK